MPVQNPEEMASAWADAYNRGDLDALVALYEPAASSPPKRARCTGMTRSATISRAS